MQKNVRLFLFLLAMLIVPALCQASTTVLTGVPSDYTIPPGSDEQVYGTSASNQITLLSGAKAELINFPGQNSIQIQSSSDLFTVSRSGTAVTFQGSDETILKIPATTEVQTIFFEDEESRVLQIYNNQVMLNDQVITTIAVSIDGGSEVPGDCGAYVAPGVWKEFDCYNLAAIGKTTNDDPFTPSWRLIGGYWQWGRKGPSSAQLEIRLLNAVQNEAGNNPVEGFSEITFTVGGEEVTTDITSIANDGTLDYTTAYDEIVDAINAQLTADGFDTVTAAHGPINDAVFSIPVAGFNTGDDAGDYYPIIVTNTGSEELAGVSFETSPLSYDTDLNCSFDASQWYDTNTEHFAHGPTGPDSWEANAGEISSWDDNYAPDGSWSDASKTANDPCPAGYRVPTESQWQGVIDNNTQSTVGTWDSDDTNYSSAWFFGSDLMLPAAGYRYDTLSDRGTNGNYWSSSEGSSYVYDGSSLIFVSSWGSAGWGSSLRSVGYSVRCVAEDSSQPQALSLSKTNVSLDIGDSENVSISGGNGYYTVSTSNSQVATAIISGNSVEIWGDSSGTATITVEDTNGATASISVTVLSPTPPSGECGAYVAPGVWKEFDCYNLAAIGKETGADPFTPSWELIGGYWQWGRKGPSSSQWYNTNTEHFAHGPIGPGSSEANAGSISGWDSSYAPDGAWSDASKTANDPCPDGYRVPTESQWQGVIDNNTQSTVGTWDSDDIDYSSARFFGEKLMLPAAGGRSNGSGSLNSRGDRCFYWSSTEDSAWNLYVDSNSTNTNNYAVRSHGLSVRCIEDSLELTTDFLYNEGFESGASGWFMGKTQGTDSELTISTDAYEGSKSAKLTVNGSGYAHISNENSIVVNESGKYKLKFYSKIGGAGIKDLTATVWKSTNSSDMPTTFVTGKNWSEFANAYELHELEMELNSGDYIRLELGIENLSGDSHVLIDNISIEQL